MYLGCRTGSPKLDGCTIVAASDLSADINVSITLNGTEVATSTITMSVAGNDRELVISPPPDGLQHACYVGHVVITGLLPFTQYAYVATNGTDTFAGDFFTAPRRTDDFAIAFTTCLHPSVATRSIFDFVEWYRLNGDLPLIAVGMPDDVFYPDTYNQINAVNGAQRKERDSNTALSEYNYSLNYMAMYGILPDSSVTHNVVNATNYQSLFRHVHFLPQAGDHEYQNNWWSVQRDYPNALHTAAGLYDGVARKAWNNFMYPLCGDMLDQSAYIDGIAPSHHWSLTLGEVQLIALDVISNAVVTDNSPDPITIDQNLGADQITEILANIQPVAFKILMNPAFAMRNGSAYVYKSETWSSATEAERDRLMLDNSATPRSIMANPWTNGMLGSTIIVRGDAHGDCCYYFSDPASGSKLAEGYHSICLVAANGGKGGSIVGMSSFNFEDFATTNFPVIDGYPGTQFSGGTARFGTSHEVCVICEVYGSRNPPEMIVRRIDRDWRADPLFGAGFSANLQFYAGDIAPDVNDGYIISFERKFCQYQGNGGFGVADETWRAPRVMSAAG